MNLLDRLSDPLYYSVATQVFKEKYEFIIHQEHMIIRIGKGLSETWQPELRIFVKLLGYGHDNDPEVAIVKTTLTGEMLERWKAIWNHLTNLSYEQGSERRDDLISKAIELMAKPGGQNR